MLVTQVERFKAFDWFTIHSILWNRVPIFDCMKNKCTHIFENVSVCQKLFNLFTVGWSIASIVKKGKKECYCDLMWNIKAAGFKELYLVWSNNDLVGKMKLESRPFYPVCNQGQYKYRILTTTTCWGWIWVFGMYCHF
jgi:hypothetical protein